MFKTSVTVRNHQVDDFGTRHSANNLCTFRAQTVLIAFAPTHQDVEAVITAPQRDQGIVFAVCSTTQGNDGVSETPGRKTISTR